ncbi:MAG: TlpA family protein disulfide reductase [Asgard group archaeon]|nr:TlpA family protein disulfide reductase [Asgard group archaeon]
MLPKKTIKITIIFPLILSSIAFSTIISETNDDSTNNLVFNPNLLDTGIFGKDFTLEDILTDSLITFSDFEGKAVILDFFATWCVPCQDSMADFAELKNSFSSDELVIISINVDSEAEIALEDFAAIYNMDWYIVIDSVNLANHYEAYGIPTIYIFDTDLRINFRQAGSPGVATLRNVVNTILNKDTSTPTPTNTSGKPTTGFWARNWYWFGILLIFIIIGVAVYIQRRRVLEHNKKIREEIAAEKNQKKLRRYR